MTTPTLMNCEHAEEGWCAACVARLGEENMRLREAIHAALPVLGRRSEETSYGHFYGGDPRDFDPDPECSTEAERESHRMACGAAERGEEGAVTLDPAHKFTTPDEARTLLAEGKVISGTIGQAHAHIHMRGFGLGTTTFRDEEIGDLFDKLAEAIR